MKKIEISLEQAKELLKCSDAKLQETIFKAYPELNNPEQHLSKEEIEELEEWTKNIRLLAAHAKVFNKGWVPNWDDDDQRKYHIWWDMTEGAATFIYAAYDFSFAAVPTRLCFESYDKAKEFAELHKELFTKVYLK